MCRKLCATINKSRVVLVVCGFSVMPITYSVAASADIDPAAQIELMRREIIEQNHKLDELQQELARQRARINVLSGHVDEAQLHRLQGRGPGNAQVDEPIAQQSNDVPRNGGDAARSGSPAQEPRVAQIFEQPGVLTAARHFALEPSIQYGYASNNRVALVGYTVIPALLIGLIDVREVKRNSLTGALTGRYGISNRFEVEAKIPYVYRSDSTVSRELFTGTATDRVFSASGKSLGDIEFGARYQFNDGGGSMPYLIGTMRYKSRTGKDPFEVITDCVTRCVGNATGSGLPLELPTGSGFQSLQPGLTWLFPSDPAVFFGSFTYTRNFSRQNVSRRILNGGSESLGTVRPGDVIGMNFGMGLALNDKSSFSVGFDLNSIGSTKQNGVTAPGSVRTQLGTLLMGYSYRLNDRVTLSVAVGAGLTRDTPDLTLNLKLPISF